MGVRGLTSFIQKRSEVCFENYELHDTNLIIDGYSVGFNLYETECRRKCNDCFGGDYDIYANVVKQFFQLLKDCNVTPYVVLDGGFENKKLATIKNRMQRKIECVTTVLEEHERIFPLMLSRTFLNVLEELKINKVRCVFEGDNEMASLSKALDCPLLSFDSDFHIFDILYIPFSFQTFDMELRKKRNNRNEVYNYLRCKVYKADNFLSLFHGLKKSHLPLVAAILGNDYIQGCVFTENQGLMYQGKKIDYVMKWLKNETVNSAANKILSRYKVSKRNLLAEKINNIIKDYSLCESKLLKYLNVNNVPVKKIDGNVELITEINMCEEKGIKYLEDLEEEKNEDFDLKMLYSLPEIFLENYKKCIYPTGFMNLVTFNKEFFSPQVEDISMPHSHTHTVNIMACMHKIITGSTNGLKYMARIGMKYDEMHAFPPPNVDLPTYEEINNTSKDARKNLLLKILDIDSSFLEDTLNNFPKQFHLLVIIIKYFESFTVQFDLYLYSIILCAIVLNYVDNEIGFVRSSDSFHSKFDSVLQNLVGSKIDNLPQTICEALQNITKNDSILCMDGLINYFEMDDDIIERYNKEIVHKLAEFQSVFTRIDHLNTLLNFPFKKLYIHHFYNGTFVYNACVDFKPHEDLDEYVNTLLCKSPSILNVFELIVSQFNVLY